MGLTNQNNYEGTAPFIDNEQVDFRMAGDIAPAADVLRAREVREATALALQSYASDTNNVDETAPRTAQNPEELYKQQAIAYLQAASRNLTNIRQHRIDTNWNLERDHILPHIDIGNLLKKTLSLITGDNQNDKRLRMPKRRLLSGISERDLLRAESAIGGALFGDIPTGISRDFFNLDATTWIWHQESTTEDRVVSTIRYEIQEGGVLKAQNGAQYSFLEGKELQDFVTAVNMYYDQVMTTVYGQNLESEKEQPQTDYRLAA